jgi:hypothetical protein
MPKRMAEQTGPKGVIADFKAAQAVMRQERLVEQLKREAMLNRLAVGDPVAEAKVAFDETDPVDSDEEEILNMYRNKLIQQSMPVWGSLERLAAGMVGVALEEQPKDSWMVVHLRRIGYEVSVRMDFILEEVAVRRPWIRFVSTDVDQLLPGFAAEGLPALACFKNGEQLVNGVRVTDEMTVHSSRFEVEHVENWLVSKGLLHKAMTPVSETSAPKHVTTESADHDSDFSFGD